jgi:penicillin-binding protein-related factor A (putative recombinase)
MAKKNNPGKDFENDIAKSAEKRGIFCYRLRDQASASFGQTDENIRFSVRNICDFIAYEYPEQYLLECKSLLKSAVPFKSLKGKESDNRIRDMGLKSIAHKGVLAFVIFNWRDHDNLTVAVPALMVHEFIKYEGRPYCKTRKSIPLQWTVENGIEITHRLKKVHYDYNLNDLIKTDYDPEVQP